MIFDSAKEKFIFYKIPTILFSLIPLFLITGPFLSDLSISLISLLFLFYCLKKKNFTYFNHKYFYFFLIFWIYLIINSLINNFNILASFRMIASPSIFCNLIATGLFLYICRPLYNFPNAPSPISDSITYLLFMSIIKDNK